MVRLLHLPRAVLVNIRSQLELFPAGSQQRAGFRGLALKPERSGFKLRFHHARRSSVLPVRELKEKKLKILKSV